jgi:hypothetical protein
MRVLAVQRLFLANWSRAGGLMLFRFVITALVAVVAGLAARADTGAPPEGLVVEIGAMVFSIPRLTVEGGPLTSAELARLADPKDKTPLDERLTRVTAKRIAIPEIRGESKAGERVTRFVYKEVVLEDIANGRIGALRAASLEQSAKGIGEKGAGGARRDGAWRLRRARCRRDRTRRAGRKALCGEVAPPDAR